MNDDEKTGRDSKRGKKRGRKRGLALYNKYYWVGI
jgi:hypothetical protein